VNGEEGKSSLGGGEVQKDFSTNGGREMKMLHV
jgi:hypothetical protein